MKDEIKRAIFLGIAVVLVVVGIKLFQNRDTTLKDLKKRGYSDEEITILLNNLNEVEIKNTINSEYNGCLPKVLSHKYYIKDNLYNYLKYCKENNNLDSVISGVNTGTINIGINKNWYDGANEITNLSNSMIVNKFNFLSFDYQPNDIKDIINWYAYGNQSIKEEVYNQFIKMYNAALKEDLRIIINSSYRTYEDQKNIHNNSSDDYAARAGFSEHQTGLALDFTTNTGLDFEETDEFKWLQTNAHKYGFILRYPKGKEHITGFSYEPWHYRYLGVELATKVYESKLTYEEYYAYYCDYKGEC